MTDTETLTCPTCDGDSHVVAKRDKDGKAISWTPCKECGGSGSVGPTLRQVFEQLNETLIAAVDEFNTRGTSRILLHRISTLIRRAEVAKALTRRGI